ncbi:MAG: hypothetical protein MJ104_10055 [Lachnospiraceae bacterium]|nr:hypothetical protein [Lachnospiraceae bacterium]
MDFISNLNIFHYAGAALILIGLIGFIVVTATAEAGKKKLVDKLSKDY